MIKSFRCKDTEKLFNDKRGSRFHSIEWQARKKLLYIHAASSLQVIGALPGHRLEALRGDRKGQYSIRINQQWRICFKWKDGDAFEVEIVDYH
jgi:proteic killer suppression protein